MKKIAAFFKPRPGTLLSPAADFLMAGGASIILFVAIWPLNLSDMSTSLGFWVTGFYFSAFLINYPHFTASYQLLYQDLGEYFFSYRENPRFSLKLWWAGLVVPVLMLAYFIFALTASTPYYMGYLANAMILTVGWHYVKQIFGCVVVLSAAKHIYYDKLERYAILTPLYLLWFVYYAGVNIGKETVYYFGVPYQPLGIPASLVEYLTLLLYISMFAGAIVLARKFIKNQLLPPLAAAAAFISIFIWFWPSNQGNIFYIVIVPFFHSLQYLLFVSAYKKNQAIEQDKANQAKAKTNYGLTFILSSLFIIIPIAIVALVMNKQIVVRLETVLQTYLQQTAIGLPQILTALTFVAVFALFMYIGRLLLKKSKPLLYIATFIVQVLVFGAMLFSLIPAALDILVAYNFLPSIFNYDSALYGTTLYLFFFTVFVNIHHYFIDNVIWKRDNPNVRQYLYTHDEDMFELH